MKQGYRYYQQMQAEQPHLLDENVNAWFRQAPERRMLRIMDGNVRAFLSDRYRRLDHLELCTASKSRSCLDCFANNCPDKPSLTAAFQRHYASPN